MNGTTNRSGAALVLLGLLVSACGDSGNPTPTSTFTTSSGSGGGGEGAGTGGDCTADSGCYECAPTQNEHFLNACTDAQCTPFDNVARLPLYNGGDLPPLP